MCFSASASFGAGAVLTGIGIASINKVRSPLQIPFASIPLLFALQQITEGFLWLSLSNPNFHKLQHPTTYIFLFFAQVVWPILVPIAILKLDPHNKRMAFKKALAIIGGLLSTYLAYCLYTYPIKASIIGAHISYQQDYPALISQHLGVLYLIATIAPPFLSRIKHMWTLGTSILVSYLVTTIFYKDYIVSVWCFFASIISITVLAILYQHNRTAQTNSGPSTTLHLSTIP